MNLRTRLGAAAMVAVGLTVGVVVVPRFLAGDSPRPPSTLHAQTKPEDIVYVRPSYLPDGWTMGWAVQRTATERDNGKTINISDYTLVWMPGEFAGRTRDEATNTGDASPSVFIQGGSAYYTGVPDGESLEDYRLNDAKPTADNGTLKLEFAVGCCIVRLYGRGIGAEELRRVAQSVSATDEETWRGGYGDRLLIDAADTPR